MADAPGENDSSANPPSPIIQIISDAVMDDGNSHQPGEFGTPQYPPTPSAPAPLWDVVDVQGDVHVMAHMMGCDICEAYVEHVGNPGWRTLPQFVETEHHCRANWAKTSVLRPEVQNYVRNLLDRERRAAVVRAGVVQATYEKQLADLRSELDTTMENMQTALKLAAEDKNDLARVRRERNQLRTDLMNAREDADDDVDEDAARLNSGRTFAADAARERAEEDLRKANDLARQWHDYANALQKQWDEHQCSSRPGSLTTAPITTAPAGSVTANPVASAGSMASIHAHATENQPQED